MPKSANPATKTPVRPSPVRGSPVRPSAVRPSVPRGEKVRPPALTRAAELFAPDAPPPATTRQRLIETAMELFYLHGFHAVGLDQVLSEVGISKQAFYKHFESKDDLAIAAIELRDVREGEAFHAQVRKLVPSGEPVATMLAMFDVLHTWFTHPDFHGCLFITACMEFPSENDPIHKAARKHFEGGAEGLTRLAQLAGADEPGELARELIALMVGAVTQRLTMGDNHSPQRVRRLAELAIASRLGKSKSPTQPPAPAMAERPR